MHLPLTDTSRVRDGREQVAAALVSIQCQLCSEYYIFVPIQIQCPADGAVALSETGRASPLERKYTTPVGDGHLIIRHD